MRQGEEWSIPCMGGKHFFQSAAGIESSSQHSVMRMPQGEAFVQQVKCDDVSFKKTNGIKENIMSRCCCVAVVGFLFFEGGGVWNHLPQP